MGYNANTYENPLDTLETILSNQHISVSLDEGDGHLFWTYDEDGEKLKDAKIFEELKSIGEFDTSATKEQLKQVDNFLRESYSQFNHCGFSIYT